MSCIYDSTPSDKPGTYQPLSSARVQFRDTLHFQVVLLLLLEHKATTSIAGRLHSSRAPLLSSLLSVPQFPTITPPAGLQHQRVIDNSPILRTNPLHTYPATSFLRPKTLRNPGATNPPNNNPHLRHPNLRPHDGIRRRLPLPVDPRVADVDALEPQPRRPQARQDLRLLRRLLGHQAGAYGGRTRARPRHGGQQHRPR